jgi:D-glycero-D-manno-heptose 1,7-bisphosphate phosphatase
MMKKCLFLDRDGVINEDRGYVHNVEDFVFKAGIFELCKDYVSKGFIIIVVTNQSGIGRGYYTEEDFHVLTDWMKQQFLNEGITLTDVFYCPYHPDGLGKYKEDSFNRKPNPGMILEAAEKYNIDLKNSVLIGDRETDMEAGKRAGVGKNILYREPNNYLKNETTSL